MKKTILVAFIALSISSCATKPIDTSTARSTPDSRIYDKSLVVPGSDKVELIVARDAGFMGGGCKTAVYLDGKQVSEIDKSEKITFYIAPGHHILGTGPNPNGTGLCHFNSERMRREMEITAELGKQLKYRLALSANGEISIMPTAF